MRETKREKERERQRERERDKREGEGGRETRERGKMEGASPCFGLHEDNGHGELGVRAAHPRRHLKLLRD